MHVTFKRGLAVAAVCLVVWLVSRATRDAERGAPPPRGHPEQIPLQDCSEPELEQGSGRGGAGDEPLLQATTRLIGAIEDGGYFSRDLIARGARVLPRADVDLVFDRLRELGRIPQSLASQMLQCGLRHPFTHLIAVIVNDLGEEGGLQSDLREIYARLEAQQRRWVVEAGLEIPAQTPGAVARDDQAISQKGNEILRLTGDRGIPLARRLAYLGLIPVRTGAHHSPSADHVLRFLQNADSLEPLICANLIEYVCSIAFWPGREDSKAAERVLAVMQSLHTTNRTTRPGLCMGFLERHTAADTLETVSRADPARWKTCSALLLDMCLSELRFASARPPVAPGLAGTLSSMEWPLLHGHFDYGTDLLGKANAEWKRLGLEIVWPAQLRRATAPGATQARQRALYVIAERLSVEEDPKFRVELAWALQDGLQVERDRRLQDFLTNYLNSGHLPLSESRAVLSALKAMDEK